MAENKAEQLAKYLRAQEKLAKSKAKSQFYEEIYERVLLNPKKQSHGLEENSAVATQVKKEHCKHVARHYHGKVKDIRKKQRERYGCHGRSIKQGTVNKKLLNFLTDLVNIQPLPPPLLNRHPSLFLIQRLHFYINIGLMYILYILMHVLLIIYLYCIYLILVYYTSLLYYTLIKNVYDPISYFTLTLFPCYCLHHSELFKISCVLVFLE